MSDDVVAKADSVLEGVTEGPWRWSEDSRNGDQELTGPDGRDLLKLCWSTEDWYFDNGHDGTFAAAARTLVPELRDEVVRLREHAGPGPYEPDCRGFKAPTWQELRDLADHNFRLYAYAHAEVERLTEQLTDIKLAEMKTRVARWNLTGPDYDSWAVCLGMQKPDVDAYLADPRGFVRQQIKDEISDAGREAYRDDARTILATIRERHAIIELPEPDYYQAASIDENGYVEWNYPHGSVAVTDDGTVMWGMWHFTDASRLRRAAAALLAAAQKADGA